MRSAIWSSITSLVTPRASLDDVFRSLPMFEKLTRRQMQQLERIVHRRTYRAGEVIFHAGDTGVAMYVILAGEVRVVVPGDTPESQVEVSRMSSGELFGEMALLDTAPRSATAIAVTPTEAAAIARPDWLDLINRQPAIGVALLLPLCKLLAARLRVANRMADDEVRADADSERE